MKTLTQVIAWICIAFQVLAYIGSAHTGLNPLLLPFVGFIAYNFIGIIGVSLVFAARRM